MPGVVAGGNPDSCNYSKFDLEIFWQLQGTQMERSMFGGKFFIPAASLSVSAGLP